MHQVRPTLNVEDVSSLSSLTFFPQGSIYLPPHLPTPSHVTSNTNPQLHLLTHARAICAACNSSMNNAQLLIILCHTVFVWGGVITEPTEQDEVVSMLRSFEKDHAWRTAWVVEALRAEWEGRG